MTHKTTAKCTWNAHVLLWPRNRHCSGGVARVDPGTNSTIRLWIICDENCLFYATVFECLDILSSDKSITTRVARNFSKLGRRRGGHKQLNSSVKIETTNSWQRIAYLKHILWLEVCEKTVLKSFLSNAYHHRETSIIWPYNNTILISGRNINFLVWDFLL